MTATQHPAAKFETGQRVELITDVDRYPHFIARKGMQGEVVEVDGELIAIRIDDKVNGAEEWENEIHWTYEDLDHIDDSVRILS